MLGEFFNCFYIFSVFLKKLRKIMYQYCVNIQFRYIISKNFIKLLIINITQFLISKKFITLSISRR